MTTIHTPRRRPAALLASGLVSAGLLLSLSSAPAFAATTAVDATPLSAEARYRADRAACIEGRTGQDRATCLKEAGAALAEARAAARQPNRGATAAELTANALARCERQPESDRADCRLRVQGRGSQQGSVAEGGILYEMVTKSVGTPAPATTPR